MTEELKQALTAELAEYCRKYIEDYDKRVELATDRAWRNHTGFELEAEWSLLEEMRDLTTEWLENNISLEDIALYAPDGKE